MYYVMLASAPSLHRESTDSLIYIYIFKSHFHLLQLTFFHHFLNLYSMYSLLQLCGSLISTLTCD